MFILFECGIGEFFVHAICSKASFTCIIITTIILIDNFHKARKILILGLASIISSCGLDEVTELDWGNVQWPNYEGEIALPIVNDTIRFRDFIDDAIEDSSTYSIDEKERILFSYDINDWEYNSMDDFIDFPDLEDSISINLSIPAEIPVNLEIPTSKTLRFKFPTSKTEGLDSIFHNSGQFRLIIENKYPFEMTYRIVSNSFENRSTGESISFTGRVPAKGKFVNSVLLEEYKTIFQTSEGGNAFSADLDATHYLREGQELTGNEELLISYKIVDPDFEVIFGYFGQDTFKVREEHINLDFFEDLGGTGIEFDAPTMELDVDNSFGLATGVDIGKVYIVYDENDTLNLHDGTPDEGPLVLEINAPAPTDWGQSARSLITIGPGNSNIRAVLSKSPTKMVLPLYGYTNLNNDGSGSRNFVIKDSKININAKITIPLRLKVDGFEYESTNKWGGMPKEAENTKELKLVIITVNELPFTGAIDIYMLDNKGKAIDSVVTGESKSLFTTPSQYDSDGKVAKPSEHLEEIILDDDAIHALIDATELKVVFRLDSYDNSSGTFVEVFADYEMIVKIGLSGNLSYNLNGK